MDRRNNEFYSPYANVFPSMRLPLNAALRARFVSAGNPPVEGGVPPVMMAVPLAVAVPRPEMAAAPAADAPREGPALVGTAAPIPNASAPAGAVPQADVPWEGPAPVGTAGPIPNAPVLGAVPISAIPPAVATDETGGGTAGSAGGPDVSGKKKRGRPKKTDPEGNSIAPSGAAAAGSSRFGKKGRGRAGGSVSNLPSTSIPSQSGEGNILPLTMVGWGFTPHVMLVGIGEDIAVKVASFAVHNGPKGICVLSGSGLVSNVSIRQPGVSGGIQSYEGVFQIIALSGSFSAADDSIRRARAGGLTVALSGADGRIIGGVIAGTLVAASPIQLLVGSFMSSDWLSQMKGKTPIQEPPSSSTLSAPVPAPAPPVNPGANIFASPMQPAGHVVNPGTNVFASPMQPAGHVVNPGTNVFASPMQPVHVVNPGTNVSSSVPTGQMGHLASSMGNLSVDRAGVNNPEQVPVQMTPPPDMTPPQSASRRG